MTDTPLSIICFSINRWEKRKARKQQFMIHLAQPADIHAVIYVEPPLNFFYLLLHPFAELKTAENRRRWKRALLGVLEPVAEKLFVKTPVFFLPFAHRIQAIYNINLFFASFTIRRCMRRAGFNRYVLWLYHPLQYTLLTLFRDRAVSVFDWAEEWALYFKEYRADKLAAIKKMEDGIIASVDVVFVVSERMRSHAAALNARTVYLIDGAIPGVFQTIYPAIPDDMRSISKPIVGYIGTVSFRIDIPLVELLARTFSQVSFVFVGEILIDVGALKACKNIFFLNGKEYTELGQYAQQFDVCLLPYLPAMTPQFPTKLFDYLSTGKPIVSTDLVAIEPFRDSVYVAHSDADLIEKLNIALAENLPAERERRVKLAMQNTWAQRTQTIMEHLREIL